MQVFRLTTNNLENVFVCKADFNNGNDPSVAELTVGLLYKCARYASSLANRMQPTGINCRRWINLTNKYWRNLAINAPNRLVVRDLKTPKIVALS